MIVTEPKPHSVDRQPSSGREEREREREGKQIKLLVLPPLRLRSWRRHARARTRTHDSMGPKPIPSRVPRDDEAEAAEAAKPALLMEGREGGFSGLS